MGTQQTEDRVESDGSGSDPGALGIHPSVVKVGNREFDLNNFQGEILQTVVERKFMSILKEVNALGVCGYQIVAVNDDSPEELILWSIPLLESEWVERVESFRKDNPRP